MHNFVEAFKFIGRNGQVPGGPHLPTLVHLTLETLKIAGLGIAIAIVIAIPVGVWLGHIHRGSFLAINLGNIWRALPSLAVLAIGVAFLGLGLRNVELALVVLAVPPFVTNAYVAIDGVDRDVVDAARGMGMTGWQVLFRVELPLGIALIFAGVRTAALFVVSTTTIAALTGYSGSLGDIINNETSYHLSGVLGAAICIAALALVTDLVLSVVQRLLTPRGLKVGTADDALASLAPVTIGDKNFTEEYILGSLYAQALAAKGYKVTVKGNIGSSEITYKALQSGQIDMYPEYTGTLLTAVAGVTAPPHSAQQAYTEAKAFAEKHGFTLLDQTPS